MVGSFEDSSGGLGLALQVWLAAHEVALSGQGPEGATGSTGPHTAESARRVLDRALQSLPRRKHVKVGATLLASSV